MTQLWAITTYFNPCRYESRRKNFDEFRRRLQVPLLVVEHAPDGGFALGEAAGDIVLRVAGGATLWQKERLLNLALARLPREARHVAWLDCDVVFADSGWPQRLAECLERVPVVQCFSEAVDLGQGEAPETGAFRPAVPSFAHLLAEGRMSLADLRPPTDQTRRAVAFGLAWAARRDLLDRHGFYDAMILGSGDRALLGAALGAFDDATAVMELSPPRMAHYLAWARPFHRSAGGRVGVVAGRVFHLWHGALADRRYRQRHHALAATGFDPHAHLRLAPSGVWDWAEAAPDALRAAAVRYFAERNEDALSVFCP